MSDEAAGMHLAEAIKIKPKRGNFAEGKKTRKQIFYNNNGFFRVLDNWRKKTRGISKLAMHLPASKSGVVYPAGRLRPVPKGKTGGKIRHPVDAAHAGV